MAVGELEVMVAVVVIVGSAGASLSDDSEIWNAFDPVETVLVDDCSVPVDGYLLRAEIYQIEHLLEMSL